MFSFHWGALGVSPNCAHMSCSVCPGSLCGAHQNRVFVLLHIPWTVACFCFLHCDLRSSYDLFPFVPVVNLGNPWPGARFQFHLLPRANLQMGLVALTSPRLLKLHTHLPRLWLLLYHQLCCLLMFKLTYLFLVGVAFLLFLSYSSPLHCSS